tara:strand:- start:352 stop:960 length:609 start_codon:yes stop_codon:yes gene_type:complete
MNEKIIKIIKSSFQENIDIKSEILNSDLLSQIEILGFETIESIKNGGKIFFAGNGGSFADSQHIAAEFVSKFLIDRRSLPAIALGTNASNMSAISNDYGYKYIFSRELFALGSRNDIFIPITTSGNSENLIEAVKVANNFGLKTFALTGATGGNLDQHCKCIKVPSKNVPRIQECHILIGHLLCQIVESEMFQQKETVVRDK